MSGLPTIDFRTIRLHAGSQDRGFEELCFQLLPALEPLQPGAGDPQRHGTPDGGVEFLVTLPDGGVWAWQAKYLFALGAKEFKQLDASVKRALDSQPTLRRYIFCLPYNQPAGSDVNAASAKQKWNDHCEKWQRWARERGRDRIEFGYVGESDLRALLTRAEHAGRAYYWFNTTVFTPQWFAARLGEAIAHAGPRYTPNLNVELPSAFVFEGLGRTRGFRDRLRERLRDLRDARARWHELRKQAVEDSQLKNHVDQAVRQLDVLDALAMAIDTAGTAPLDFTGTSYSVLGSS